MTGLRSEFCEWCYHGEAACPECGACDYCGADGDPFCGTCVGEGYSEYDTYPQDADCTCGDPLGVGKQHKPACPLWGEA